jgi:hypothetical protein
MSNYKFSGHETFHCRHFWIKKGVDFVDNGHSFKSDTAVVELGVGKNMAASINYWLQVFDLVEDNSLSDFAKKIFRENGFDPYLEDISTIWLLHYKLLKKNSASIYRLIFEEFRKTRVSSEFTVNQLFDFLNRKLILNDQSISSTTIDADIKVFIKNYISSNEKNNKNLEDDFSSIFIALNLISTIPDSFENGLPIYLIEYNAKNNLNPLILLYAIKDSFVDEISIPVSDIQTKVSDLFLCNREGTEEKLLFLQENGYLVYKENAGRKEIQFKDNRDIWDILNEYYETYA